MEIVAFLFKWVHLLFGLAWIGMLYYFNFVQMVYFKEASAEGLSDAKAKLAPRALRLFRLGAEVTFATGIVLLVGLFHKGLVNDYIVVGALLGTFMFLNVVMVIVPNQKVVLGLRDGDAALAGPKAALASRTNTLFSGPMAFFMLASHQFGYSADHMLSIIGLDLGLILAVIIVVVLEANALFGKLGPIASIRGVIHSSLALSALLFCLMLFL